MREPLGRWYHLAAVGLFLAALVALAWAGYDFTALGLGAMCGFGMFWFAWKYDYGGEDSIRRINELKDALERESRFRHAEERWIDHEYTGQERPTDPAALPRPVGEQWPPFDQSRER